MQSDGGQYRFWGYDFKFIPIELISAVYDRFLGDREKKTQGAYYTPMFLADTVISQVWDTLSSETMEKGHFLDPACGSGVFLVRLFQHLCEHWRQTRNAKTIRWNSLLTILSRLHGWDINGGAVRVAAFSLYIALLEQVRPPDLQLLIKRGKLLPQLFGKNLCHRDFFTVNPNNAQVDVIIGNPPWRSRGRVNRTSVKWCNEKHFPMPEQEDAWAFVWKSLLHINEGGTVAFLLPAMAFLHNLARKTVYARNKFMREARISRIINFADLRRNLFEGAVRPSSLIIYGHATQDEPDYRFDYWAPKGDLNLKTKRLITLSSADKCTLTSRKVEEDPFAFNRRLWMNDPESKLFNYLSTFPKLGDITKAYLTQKQKRTLGEDQWLIGYGFQPLRNAEEVASQFAMRSVSDCIGKLPYLPINAFQPLSQPVRELPPWHSNQVNRKGFEKGFVGSRVLIPRGVDTKRIRLRASYIEEPLTFRHIIQALVFLLAMSAGQNCSLRYLTAG